MQKVPFKHKSLRFGPYCIIHVLPFLYYHSLFKDKMGKICTATHLIKICAVQFQIMTDFNKYTILGCGTMYH
jgi:hypothetical protein